jgi:hypothetical protein
MAREFEELTLDVKISLTFHGIMVALTPPREREREAAFLNTFKY